MCLLCSYCNVQLENKTWVHETMGQKGLNMKFSYIDILINDLPSIQNVQGKKQLTYSFNTWYLYEVKQCLH